MTVNSILRASIVSPYAPKHAQRKNVSFTGIQEDVIKTLTRVFEENEFFNPIFCVEYINKSDYLVGIIDGNTKKSIIDDCCREFVIGRGKTVAEGFENLFNKYKGRRVKCMGVDRVIAILPKKLDTCA